MLSVRVLACVGRAYAACESARECVLVRGRLCVCLCVRVRARM